jgi:hypothetical protein
VIVAQRQHPTDGPLGGRAKPGQVASHFTGCAAGQGPGGHERPLHRTRVAPIEDRFKVQVASRRPTGAAHLAEDLARVDLFARTDSDGLKMVVRCDQAVAVIDFHPVAASPRVPACSTHQSRVRRVNARSAGGGIVLPQMEVAGSPGQRAHPETEGRAGIEQSQWRHQEAGRRPAEACRSHRQRRGVLPAVTAYCRMGKGDKRPWVRKSRCLKHPGTNPVRTQRVRASVAWRGCLRTKPGSRGFQGLPLPCAAGKVQGPDG